MIQLKPFFFNDLSCPECHSTFIDNADVLIEGLHALADNVCTQCGFEFFQLLRVGHTIDYPICFGKRNSKLYDNENAWVSKGLLKYFQLPGEESVDIKRNIYRKCKNVVLLNTLDFLYGHTLLKLLNCQHHLDSDSDRGLIVIIPKNFEWLVPEGCAEVWVVDLPLPRLHYRFAAINEFIKKQLNRFESVFLSRAYTHPDFNTIDISRFTGVRPFEIQKIASKPFQITFVLREDRWWLESEEAKLLSLALRKAGLKKVACRLLSTRQNTLVKDTIKAIRQTFPDAGFCVVGLGNQGKIHGVHDKRVVRLTDEIEKEWCRIYSNSQLVIGMHGSNMILPTAHAAGCIEILPEDRIPNIVQDIAVRISDRRQLFLYRFVSEHVKPTTVAAHVISILQGYETFNRNMCINQPGEFVHDKDSSTK